MQQCNNATMQLTNTTILNIFSDAALKETAATIATEYPVMFTSIWKIEKNE